MNKLTTFPKREIVKNFTKEISIRKTEAKLPDKISIHFRNERREGKERDAYLIPIELLRYRKDNGRIASDVLAYEKNFGKLDEEAEETQAVLKEFLEAKDVPKTEELRNAIRHEGQVEPAIITCDGFLINGNRRKMVLENLFEETRDPAFERMKVVILPGPSDPGGPPTLLEIEQIENRYQLQSDGKSEYTGFDRALSMRRKIEIGMDLESQLRDDPRYSGLPKKELRKEMRKMETEYIKPLICVDRYLGRLNRPGLYSSVSSGVGDPEGRWESFKDFAKLYDKLNDDKQRIKLSVEEEEVGNIEDIAFKIIRKRRFPGQKAHMIIRELPKLISNQDSKEELLKLIDIDFQLKNKEREDAQGNEYTESELDEIWGKKYAEDIIKSVKKAQNLLYFKEEKENSLSLLEGALKKLHHDKMEPEAVAIGEDIEKAIKLCDNIRIRAKELGSIFYSINKENSGQRLKEKFKKRVWK